MTEPTPPPAADPGAVHPGPVVPSSGVEIETRRPAVEGRGDRAARSLENLSIAFLYGVIPSLLVAAVLIKLARSDRPALPVILSAVAGVLAASVLASLLRGFAVVVRSGNAQAEAFARLERNLAEGLGRISASIEAAQAGRPAEPTPTSVAGLKAQHTAEIRHAIRSGHWEEAGTLVQAFGDTHPDDPSAARLAGELSEARRVAGQDRLA